MNDPKTAICRCTHARLRHTAELEGMCAAPHCECIQFCPVSGTSVPPRQQIKPLPAVTDSPRSVPLHTEPQRVAHSVEQEPVPPAEIPGEIPADPADSAGLDEKTCTKCGQTKPLDEFYQRRVGEDYRMPSCRDCDRSRPRGRSAQKIVRVRARHRATAELIKRHDAEFRELLTAFTINAQQEADRLAEQPEAAEVYEPTETVRLKPGQRRKGQEVTERIDVARCPHCIKHHDRGHLCTECGAAPAPNVVAAWQTSNRRARDASKQAEASTPTGIAAWATGIAAWATGIAAWAAS